MPYSSSNKTKIGDTQVRNREVEAVAAAAIREGLSSPGDGSRASSISPVNDPERPSRLMHD